MAQAIRRNTRPSPVTIGSMLPKIVGGAVGAVALWAMFSAALAADVAHEAAAAQSDSNLRAALTGELRAAQERCAVEGIGC